MIKKQTLKTYSFELKKQSKPIELKALSANDAAKKLYQRVKFNSQIIGGFGHFIGDEIVSCAKITKKQKKQQTVTKKEAQIYNKYKNLFE